MPLAREQISKWEDCDVLKSLLAAFLVSFSITPVVAQEKTTVTFGYLADPSHEAALYALRKGLVVSDTVHVEATPLDVAALQQATAARTFDVIQTAAMAVPRAKARGLPLEVIGTGLRNHKSGASGGIWVPADSQIRDVRDLKGKRLAVYSMSSAGITLTRLALHHKWGLNVAAPGGDIQFVELPAPAMPAALAAGRVDAATLVHSQAYQASQTNNSVHLHILRMHSGRHLNCKWFTLCLRGIPIS